MIFPILSCSLIANISLYTDLITATASKPQLQRPCHLSAIVVIYKIYVKSQELILRSYLIPQCSRQAGVV